MPYIKQEERKRFDHLLDDLIWEIKTPAEATYCIYRLIKERFGDMKQDHSKNPNWEWKSEGTKVLKCAMDEYHDRVIKPHEDDAIARNGDI